MRYGWQNMMLKPEKNRTALKINKTDSEKTLKTGYVSILLKQISGNYYKIRLQKDPDRFKGKQEKQLENKGFVNNITVDEIRKEFRKKKIKRLVVLEKFP